MKIAQLGDLDRIPNNVPHPGCAFEVQWYGFDAGADVVSAVSFTPQAPTGGVTISVDGPSRVPVGQDAASGAGTATGLDAVATYRLGFSGEAPAKQGYHVRLTVATPRSLGNDTKTKVFWVEPCASTAAGAAQAAPAGQATSSGLVRSAGQPAAAQATVAAQATAAGAAGAEPSASAQGFATSSAVGAGASAAAGSGGSARTTAAGVPTTIDAGERHSLISRVATSPWAWGLIGLGAVCVAGGLAAGARRRA